MKSNGIPIIIYNFTTTLSVFKLWCLTDDEYICHFQGLPFCFLLSYIHFKSWQINALYEISHPVVIFLCKSVSVSTLLWNLQFQFIAYDEYNSGIKIVLWVSSLYYANIVYWKPFPVDNYIITYRSVCFPLNFTRNFSQILSNFISVDVYTKQFST